VSRLALVIRGNPHCWGLTRLNNDILIIPVDWYAKQFGCREMGFGWLATQVLPFS